LSPPGSKYHRTGFNPILINNKIFFKKDGKRFAVISISGKEARGRGLAAEVVVPPESPLWRRATRGREYPEGINKQYTTKLAHK
jgi:hypothetical protein